MEETIHATGHENVTGEHTSTFEVTTEDFLTPAGDCVLGINADKSPVDLDRDFVSACRDAGATITATIEADGHLEVVTGSGHPDLTFTGDVGMVGRTSTYVDERTIMVDADKAAADFDRDLIDALANGADLTLTLRVE